MDRETADAGNPPAESIADDDGGSRRQSEATDKHPTNMRTSSNFETHTTRQAEFKLGVYVVGNVNTSVKNEIRCITVTWEVEPSWAANALFFAFPPSPPSSRNNGFESESIRTVMITWQVASADPALQLVAIPSAVLVMLRWYKAGLRAAAMTTPRWRESGTVVIPESHTSASASMFGVMTNLDIHDTRPTHKVTE
ncbi:hypothetical protein EDD15DRAFT_2195541 [Pisolithus albus]|nr:hypothetical protein EDD15DRAFT_2195541 [Pisolithus albus]